MEPTAESIVAGTGVDAVRPVAGPMVDLTDVVLPGLQLLPRDPAGLTPMADAVAFLASVDVDVLPADFDVLELVAAWATVTRACEAATTASIAAFAALSSRLGADAAPATDHADGAPGDASVRPFLADEVAARLAEGLPASHRRCRAAIHLPSRFPRIWAEHRAGRLSGYQAAIVVDGCSRLDDDQARRVDDRLAGRALGLTPARLRQAVQRALLQVDPAAAARRRERAAASRQVRVCPTSDGMAELWALLPAVDACALTQALDAAAASARSGGDERTRDQLRADHLVAAVTGVDPARTAVEVQVVVPASVLLGLTDDPAELVGYGPIDAGLARCLARDATWRRLLTDDEGALAATGSRTYRPGTLLARHVATRDLTCRFPGCDRPAAGCDLDHTVPFGARGGLTSPDNLGPLCRHHHRLKHAPTATGPPTLRQEHAGRFHWVLPTGHHHQVVRPRLLEPDDPLHRTPSPAEARLSRHLAG